MNYRTLALIGVRLLAIWLIVTGISRIPWLPTTWAMVHAPNVQGPGSALPAYMMVTAAIVAPLILGIVLWALAPWLARWLAPIGGEAVPSAGAAELVQGAIAIAGLVLAVTAIPPLVFAIFNVVGALPGVLPMENWLPLAKQSVLVLLALSLVVGARRLRDWIFRLRTIGT